MGCSLLFRSIVAHPSNYHSLCIYEKKGLLYLYISQFVDIAVPSDQRDSGRIGPLRNQKKSFWSILEEK